MPGCVVAFCAALLLAIGAPARGQDSRPETRPGEETVELHLALAAARLETGDLRAARHHADRAQALAPADPRAAVLAGHVLYRMGEEAADRSGSAGPLVRATFADAATSYDEAVQLGADPHPTAFWAAEAHHRAGAPGKALAAIERALDSKPDDDAAIVFKGRMLLDLGRPADAIPDLDRILILRGPRSPAAADAAVLVVTALLRAADVAELRSRVSLFTGGDPYGAADRILSTVWAALKGSPREPAWELILDDAERQDPPRPVVAYYRAELAMRRMEDAKALDHIARYLQAAPGDPAGHLLRAVALRRLGRPDDARQALGKAYDLGGDRASITSELRPLVAAFYGARRYREAAEVQGFVVHLTASPEDRHDHAVLSLDAGSPADAEAIYRLVAGDEDAPLSERARARNALGLLLQSQGRLDEAEVQLRAAAAEDSANLDARENLGILLVRAGRPLEGRAELEACRAADPMRKRALYHLTRLMHPEVP